MNQPLYKGCFYHPKTGYSGMQKIYMEHTLEPKKTYLDFGIWGMFQGLLQVPPLFGGFEKGLRFDDNPPEIWMSHIF